MVSRKLAIAITLVAVISACSEQNSASAFVLQNGVELPLHELGKLQPACEILGQRMPSDYNGICVEFPASALSATFEPMNWYGGQLTDAGFEWASGAANQYWFNWPVADGCFLRLNTTALPKERVEGDDWSSMKDYVLLFEFEAESRCPN